MAPIHVFVVMASGAQGGGANHLLALLPALHQEGVRTTAWVGDDGPLAQQLLAQGIPARAVPLMGHRGDVMLGRRIVAAAQHSHADLMHAHGTRAGVLCALGAATLMAPPIRIYSAHGLAHRAGAHPMSRTVRLGAEWLACAGAGAAISVSASDLEVLGRLPGLRALPRFHVPNVVTCTKVLSADGAIHVSDDQQQQQQARARFGLPQKSAIVGTVSRLVPQKNVMALAEAVLNLQHAHLAVVGEGPERALLARHRLAQQGRLHLLGARDDVPAFLPALDVFALSSRWEGEPIALLEAMAFGLPWVATTTLGAAEIQRATGTGTLVPQRNTQAFAHALQILLSDAAARMHQGRIGMQAMASRTPRQLALRVAGIYRQVLGR